MNGDEATGRSCPWCSTAATDIETTCSSCGAALAQHETLGDVAIPGLTAVHPALVAADGRPIHLTGPSPSHSVADGAIVAAMIGGPAGLAVLGGIAAVAAAEYAGAKRDAVDWTPENLAAVGRPSELALLALERADADGPPPEAGPATSDTGPPASDPWRDLPPTAQNAEPRS